jgi:nucleoside phosphorylase
MRFAVVTGLALEAARLDGREIAIVTGAGAAAEAAAERMVEAGARALLSLGLCGGLAPALDTGDAVLATEVATLDGECFATDAAWRESLEATLSAASHNRHAREGGRPSIGRRWRVWMPAFAGMTGEGVHGGRLLGADGVVLRPARKQELAAATGALAVDTESHRVARVAARAGLPFAAIRVVIDRAADDVPAAALAAYGPDGRIRPLALLLALLARPSDLPGLLRLAARSRRALAALGGVGRLGARLGPPL